MGTAEASPVLGEVDEADVGKNLCQYLWGGAELLEMNTEISLKNSSKAGVDLHPSFKCSLSLCRGDVLTQQIHVFAGLPFGGRDEEATFTPMIYSTGVRVSKTLACSPLSGVKRS